MIPREIIDEILYRSDITDVIGSYVSLKRAGSNMSGLCPFHSEKSPSFTVFPATKSFYCFGCGAGGDVITFIKKAENLDYPSAVEFLAARAGITIPEDKKYVKSDEVSRRRVFDMNLEAAKFFRQCLFDEKIGAPGREYLAKRKLSGATIKHFGLGFAPDSFNMLTDYLHSKGFSDHELTTAFLCGKSQKTGRCYDYFRGKVMFPVIDVAGNIIAFGGRVLDNSKPKYINSSDTPGFKKSRNLFALNFAKSCCSEEMILCEGYMDVIALHAAGFENAVATLGTAITPEQARLMAKYTKKVIISYDGDAAGQNATNKAMKLLSEVGLEVRVLTIPDNMDPDDYIKAHGPDRFKQLLESGKTGFEFKLNGVLSKYNITEPAQKIRASAAICEIIASVASAVEREVYIREAAKRIDVTAETLKNDVERHRRKMVREMRKNESSEALKTVHRYGDTVNPDAAKNVKMSSAEEAIIGMLLQYDDHRAAVANGKIELTADDFFTDFGRRVFRSVMELEMSEGGFSFSLLGESFNPDEMGRMIRYVTERKELSQNTLDVLRESVNTLKKERQSHADRTGDDPFAALRRKREALKKKKDEQ
ncbi:MAG: DNA primase [Clostridia bacterium]|nr:DNA primase [Clostridia bacterium]